MRGSGTSTTMLGALGLVLALSAGIAGGVTAASPTRPTADAPAAPDSAVRLERHLATGSVTLVAGTRPGRPAVSWAALGRPRTASAAGRAFLQRFGTRFGIGHGGRDVRLVRTQRSPTGTTLRYQQLHRGIPVLGGDVMVHLDRGLAVVTANGEASPDLDVPIDPSVRVARAKRLARAAVARASGLPASRLRASRPALWIYDPRLLGGRDLPYPRLVWRITVADAAGSVDQLVAVDARRPVVALRFGRIERLGPAGAPAVDATQHVCDQGNKDHPKGRRTPQQIPCTDTNDLSPSEIAAVKDRRLAFTYAEDTYDFYRLRFGRDSIDGAGMAIDFDRALLPAGRWRGLPLRQRLLERQPDGLWLGLRGGRRRGGP